MNALSVLRRHWPEYLIEAGLLATFMLSASLFGVLLEHPGSWLRAAIPDPIARRGLMGLAMGSTAVALVYSPFGQRSGAHFNPAVTLTFLWLGKVRAVDAAFYVAAQFVGGVGGMVAARALLRGALADPAVNHVVTVPGELGLAAAFAAEVGISALLMTVVLWSASRPRLARATGLLAGLCVALFITFEAPLSGMSMNPARTFGSALSADVWSGGWIYFTAPLVGMLGAAALRRGRRSAPPVPCAKLHHQNPRRCIFCGANA